MTQIKRHKKYTKRNLRRVKSRKVMKGGISKIYRENGGSLPRLFTMQEILTLLQNYDITNRNEETYKEFRKPFLEEISGSENIEDSPTLKELSVKTTDGKNMYSLSRLREFDFGPRSVNVALFKHPYTPEEIVEIMFNMKGYFKHITQGIPTKYAEQTKQNELMKFIKFINNQSLPERFFDNLNSQNDETVFKKTLSEGLTKYPILVRLFDKAIRDYHYEQSRKQFSDGVTIPLLGSYMS